MSGEPPERGSRGPLASSRPWPLSSSGAGTYAKDLVKLWNFSPYDADVDGSPWIIVLDQLIALEPEIVVPGHGEVTDVTVIRNVLRYLDYVRGEAERLRATGPLLTMWQPRSTGRPALAGVRGITLSGSTLPHAPPTMPAPQYKPIQPTHRRANNRIPTLVSR